MWIFQNFLPFGFLREINSSDFRIGQMKSTLSHSTYFTISRKILNWRKSFSRKINFNQRIFDISRKIAPFHGKSIQALLILWENEFIQFHEKSPIICWFHGKIQRLCTNMKNIPCRKSFHGKTFLISCLFTIFFRFMEISPRSRFHGRWIRISKTRTQPFWKTHRKIALSKSRNEFSGFEA